MRDWGLGTENDLAAGWARLGWLCCCCCFCCSFGMLITSIYCAHNMGAHCACSPRSPSCLISKCSSSLSSTLVDSGSSGYVRRMHRWTRCCCCWLRCVSFLVSFARPFSFFFLFLLLLHSKFNYRECEFLPDSESDSASHVLFQHRRLSANFQRISILFAVDLCNARPFEAHAFPSSRPPP